MRGIFTGALAVWAAVPVAAANFTTAEEVRPILQATTASWVAVREWDGKDLLYFTHLEAWRCGLEQIRYVINESKPEVWEVEPCYDDGPVPNAIRMEGRVPYTEFPLGSVGQVTIEVTYDDGEIEKATFERKAIQID